MKNCTTQGFILGHKNLGESDKLIFFYSVELGKIKIIAKGARKITSKFTGHLETLNHCTIEIYFGPKNTILKEVTTNNNYLKNEKELCVLGNALKIAEFTDRILYAEQTLENLEELIKGTLTQLTQTKNPDLILIAFIIKLLDKAGHIPDFKSTSLGLPEKYLKFFNFIKENPLPKIEQISLSREEEKKINYYTQIFSQPLS